MARCWCAACIDDPLLKVGEDRRCKRCREARHGEIGGRDNYTLVDDQGNEFWLSRTGRVPYSAELSQQLELKRYNKLQRAALLTKDVADTR